MMLLKDESRPKSRYKPRPIYFPVDITYSVKKGVKELKCLARLQTTDIQTAIKFLKDKGSTNAEQITILTVNGRPYNDPDSQNN
jgi:hypothetical protein